MTPASRIAKLKAGGLPIPAKLLEEHRAYGRESKRRCRRVKKFWGPGTPIWLMTYRLNPVGYYFHIDTVHKKAWPK